jgi:hypothetical protein
MIAWLWRAGWGDVGVMVIVEDFKGSWEGVGLSICGGGVGPAVGDCGVDVERSESVAKGRLSGGEVNIVATDGEGSDNVVEALGVQAEKNIKNINKTIARFTINNPFYR